MAKNTGLKINRKYTSPGDPYKDIVWEKRSSKITNPDGSVVFEMNDVEIPSTWSQVATDIMVSKYFRKAGVPQTDENGNELKDDNGDVVLGPETSSKQVFNRLAETWRHWGEETGYFASTEDAQAFEDELKYMLATQMAAPNSPQWFNTGLNYKYGLTGKPQGFWYVDPSTGDIDFTKYGSDGVTRIVGRYDDPLVPDFGSLNIFLEDGVTLSPVSSADDPNRFVDLNNNNIFEDYEDRLKLNSQIRLNNDLAIDNLIPKKAGDFDGDGFQEIYWKTFDETCYLRAVMHSDGNIQYANYQSESQMREYLTTNGNADSINEII